MRLLGKTELKPDGGIGDGGGRGFFTTRTSQSSYSAAGV